MDMYGKIFESLYTGSMVGRGSAMFAVWGYVIANMKPEKVVSVEGKERKMAIGAHVELNHKLLAFILGEKESVVEKVIEELCSPDPQSRSKEEQGRRLIKLSEFDYRVVNGEQYRSIRSAEDRREYQRKKQKEYRVKRSKPLPGEMQYIKHGTTMHEHLKEEPVPYRVSAPETPLPACGDGEYPGL